MILIVAKDAKHKRECEEIYNKNRPNKVALVINRNDPHAIEQLRGLEFTQVYLLENATYEQAIEIQNRWRGLRG